MAAVPRKSRTPQLPTTVITEGPVPKHAQLRAIIDELCTTHLHSGDLLPGERVLEEAYGVSRITVRRAIGDLVASGRLRRVRGKGTFVAPHPLVSRLHLASFSSEMATQHVTATSRILHSEQAPAPPEVVAFFASPADTPHTHLRRLRLGDGEPYAIDDGWYHAGHVPDLLGQVGADVSHSLYALLENHYQLPVTDADQVVTAVNADARQASLLDVPTGTALLRVVRCSRSGTVPVEWCASLYRTDRYRLNTRVTRDK